MVTIPKADSYSGPHPHWRTARPLAVDRRGRELDRFPPGTLTIFVCPRGDESLIVSAKHGITADGVVTPSAVCPAKGCTFHEFIRLDGWEG